MRVERKQKDHDFIKVTWNRTEVSWIPAQSIVHSLHYLLKAFLVFAGWKGWRGEG